ncbi:hypothetical protein L195_g049944 [Trifolium pratense]|uniref:F-box associated beta-propeller type 3 domain-containing protein n=1 Tax=Trifolium pratense TaxID=57577 RepID=A0A2K3JR93_TRIPR|nr:hypothetical protein L195_g049944 [Trifolium pratense]
MTTKHHHLISAFASSVPYEFIHMSYPLSSVFTEVTTTAMQLEYPLMNRYRFDPIVGSCRGILCILDYSFVFLWNPSIRKFTKLPSFEDSSSHMLDFSFGYDHSSDSYKVVAFYIHEFVINGNRVMKIIVKVHTLGTNSWRRIQDFPSRSFCEDSSGKFVCGTINWLTYRDRTSSLKTIISLDLETESYLEIVQPNSEGNNYSRIGVLRDCLCLFSRSSDTFTDIWLMKEYGNKESWIKLFRVPDIRDLDSFPYVYPLYVSEDDQVLLQIESELFVYNSRDGTFKDLNIRNTNGVTGTTVYHESLISPCF